MKCYPACLLLVGWGFQAVYAQDASPPTPPSLMFAKEAPDDLEEIKILQKRIRRVIRKAGPATVKVGGGSGVVIDPDGTVLTVAHLARTADRSLTITFPDGKKVRGTTLGSNHNVDAALIKIQEEGPWPFVRMGASDELVSGQWCVAMGFPMTFAEGKAPHVRVGRVLHNNPNSIMTDCVIMGGDSGGPLFDLNGRVIGISSRCDKSLIRNFHVPIDHFHEDWDRLVSKEVWDSHGPGGPFLGVGPSAGTDEPRLGMVIEESGAAEAGLKVGDVVLEFDGREVETYHQLVHLIREKKPDQEVDIKVKRGEETLDLKVTIGKRGER